MRSVIASRARVFGPSRGVAAKGKSAAGDAIGSSRTYATTAAAQAALNTGTNYTGVVRIACIGADWGGTGGSGGGGAGAYRSADLAVTANSKITGTATVATANSYLDTSVVIGAVTITGGSGNNTGGGSAAGSGGSNIVSHNGGSGGATSLGGGGGGGRGTKDGDGQSGADGFSGGTGGLDGSDNPSGGDGSPDGLFPGGDGSATFGGGGGDSNNTVGVGRNGHITFTRVS